MGVAMVIGAVASLVTVIRGDAALKTEVAELNQRMREQTEEIQRLKALNQQNLDALNKFNANAENWGRYVDASLCELGVKPPYECPEVGFLATRPGAKHPIQPQLGVPVRPLGK